MSKYGLRWDRDAGLQVILIASGVPFEVLPALVFEIEELSEFERHQAARQLRAVTRRPYTTVTNLSHLIKEPMLAVSSKPEDYLQYRLEIYSLGDEGAEVVVEYPQNGAVMPFWTALAEPERATGDGILNNLVTRSASSGSVSTFASPSDTAPELDACSRFTFQLNKSDMASLLVFCKELPR